MKVLSNAAATNIVFELSSKSSENFHIGGYLVKPRDVWLNLSEFIKFYNISNFDSVPNRPGIYGWFLPLAIKHGQDPFDLVPLSSKFAYHDCVANKQTDESIVGMLKFNWDELEIRGRKKKSYNASADKATKYDRISKDPIKLEFFEKFLVASTIFTQPIYVGLTIDLKKRCYEHIEGRDKNDFNSRFNAFVEKNKVNLKVRDLYFACCVVDLPDDVPDKEKQESEIIDVLEEILKNIIKPSFGVR